MSAFNNHKRELLLMLLFIPVAFGSYLFHELGHWSIGELLGNDMHYSLNLVWPESGHYVKESHDLWVSIGGPAFTIFLALIFLLVIEKYMTIYAYPVVFFQFFMRFFSLLFGGLSKQDESRISVMLELGKFVVPLIGVAILFFITWRASSILKIPLKKNGYLFFVSTVCILIVIGTYKLLG